MVQWVGFVGRTLAWLAAHLELVAIRLTGERHIVLAHPQWVRRSLVQQLRRQGFRVRSCPLGGLAAVQALICPPTMLKSCSRDDASPTLWR